MAHFPTCDAECTRLGWVEYMVEAGCHDLHISCPPDTDLDGQFVAFCHDTQERITVNGWACGIRPVGEEA